MEQICQRCITNAYIRHLSIDRVQLANCSMLMTSECAGLRIIRSEKAVWIIIRWMAFNMFHVWIKQIWADSGSSIAIGIWKGPEARRR
jgi:hypothetical protein